MLATVFPMAVTSDDTEIVNPIPIDIGDSFRDGKYGVSNNTIATILDGTNPDDDEDWGVGDPAYWKYLDDFFGTYITGEYYYWTTYTCLAKNGVAEVWVQDDLSWYFLDDPRETPVITTQDAEYILEEFTKTGGIRETDITYFGNPDVRTGSDASLEGTILLDSDDNPIYTIPDEYYTDTVPTDVILISNIRDENYYFADYPYYIAGFYSSYYASAFDRNIITIDAYDWANRTGPGTSQVYEGTVAHEYQHLIHNDVDPLEEDWVNEGCSMYAETLCGYGFQTSSANRFMYTPDNSLTFWEDQGGLNVLADYGQVYLFMMYLNDHFGGANTISDICASQFQGIDGIMDGLTTAGYTGATFEGIFHNWVLANYFLNYNSGPYGYNSYDVAELVNPLNLHVPPYKEFLGSDLGETFSYDGDGTGVFNLGPWSADYIAIDEDFPIDLIGMWFDGDNLTEYPYFWEIDDTSGDAAFWGGDMSLATTNFIITPLDLTGCTTASLTFDTYYDIEEQWDFGFVQVSTDNGSTWDTLGNASTKSVSNPDTLPEIIFYGEGFTGTIGDWTSETFVLDAYAGQEILLRFFYLTDWVYTEAGWWIDNVSVECNTGIVFQDDCSTFDQWMSPSDLYGYFDVDFSLTFIKPDGTIIEIPTSDLDEMAELLGNFGGQSGVLVVSYVPSHSLNTTVNYAIQFRQSAGAVVATFPMYGNVLPQLNAHMEQFMEMIASMAAEGEDTSAYEAALEEANGYVASASFGANYLFRANQLRKAMQILASLL